MKTFFSHVADSYDEVRPNYPTEIADAIAAYAGPLDSLTEIASGTGKGTEILARLGLPMTCVEPDPGMAAALQAHFPQARIIISTFEEWQPPATGVPLLSCAMAWHWLEADTRVKRAYEALRPGGTLAVFGHYYDFAFPAHEQAITDAFASSGVTGQQLPRRWFFDEIAGSGLWADTGCEVITRDRDYTTEQYVRLHSTFSPHLRRTPAQQERVLDAIREAVDGLGGTIRLRLPTTLALARRPA